MTLLKSKAALPGSRMIDFSLPDTEGKIHSPSDYETQKVLVIIFMCNHCPYVRAIKDRLINLQAQYDSNDVQLIGINANDWEQYPDDSPENSKKIIQEWGINFPYLYDETQESAKAYDAQCTPDIYVFDQKRKLAYRGRIDDSWQDPEKVTREELKEAIDQLLKGEKPSEEQYPTIGCSIKWKSN